MLVVLALLAVTLSPPLEQWKAEIEQIGGLTVVLTRVPADRMTSALPLALDLPRRALLEPITSQPGFVAQYRGAQAMTVNVLGENGAGRTSFVLINPKHAGSGHEEEAIIAHEFGHIWLKAQRYPAPAYQGGEAACLSVHTLDAVQHILIREEMEKRGMAWRRPWLRGLEAALLQMEQEPGAAQGIGRCQTLNQAVMWVDAELGAGDWPRKAAFLAALRRRFPIIVPAAEEISARLQKADVRDKSVHREMLFFVFERLKHLALAVPVPGIP